MGAKPVEELKPEQIAEESTYLAAERTLFSVLSTGLSIAAGGALSGSPIARLPQAPVAEAPAPRLPVRPRQAAC